MPDLSVTPSVSRLPRAWAGLSLLWAVGAYTHGGSRALWGLVLCCAVVAVIVPKPLLRGSRAIIWGGLLLGVAAYSANLARIIPPEELDLYRAYQYDRLVTLALAPALAALFIRPNRVTVTLVLVGCLAPIMLALVRLEMGGERSPAATALIGIGLGLPFLMGQAQRLTQPRPADVAGASGAERVSRFVWPGLAIVLAGLAAVPLSVATDTALEWAYTRLGFDYLSSRTSSRSLQRLSLRTPPGGFEGRVRPFFFIDTSGAPGYLREAAYVQFMSGEWRLPTSSETRIPVGMQSEPMRYTLVPDADATEPEAGRVEILPGFPGTGMCLPIDAVAFALDEVITPALDRDGTGELDPPGRTVYPVWMKRGAGIVDSMPLDSTRHRMFLRDHSRRRVAGGFDASDWPWLAEPGDDYLQVPEVWEDTVRDWVSDVDGLREADGSIEAMAAVVRYFHTHYEYALELQGAGDDLLHTFREERRGHCTLFATAATFLLRARGIPARVAVGYVCHERHPLTKRWVARERDGHAWCEAWDAGSGRWHLVEATPPGSIPGNFSRPGRGRLWMEWLGAQGRAFRTWLNERQPLIAVAEFGVAAVRWVALFLRTPAGLLATTTFAVIVVLLVRRRLRKPVRSGEDEMWRRRVIKAMVRFERKTVPSALRRRRDEPWADWAARVAGELPPAYSDDFARIVEAYQTLRYRRTFDRASTRSWLARVDAWQAGKRGRTRYGSSAPV